MVSTGIYGGLRCCDNIITNDKAQEFTPGSIRKLLERTIRLIAATKSSYKNTSRSLNICLSNYHALNQNDVLLHP